MSATPTTEPTVPPEAAPARASSRRPGGAVLGLLGILGAAIVTYVLLSLHGARPVLFPDEFRYAHLARSLADGDGFVWRSEHLGQTAALYVYFITPAWALFHSTVDAYHLSKVMSAIALCTTAIPVWFLAREPVGPRLALVPAGLAVAGTWMIASAELVTETLAFPLTTAALCCFVMALQRPRRAVAVLAVVFLVLAIWARIQVAVLIPAFFLAYAIDTVRVPSELRRRVAERRGPLIAMAVVAIAVTVVAFAAPGITGDYKGFVNIRPTVGDLIRKSGVQLLQLVAAGGFAPLAVTVAATASGPAWRDRRTGPMLAVFWSAALALAVESGWFLTSFPTVAAIERYMTYVLPLALVLATVVVVDRALIGPRAIAVGVAAMLVLLLRPKVGEIGEERANWATAFRMHQLTGLSTGLALTLAALVVCGITLALLARSGDAGRRVGALAAVVVVVFAVQDQAAWHQLFRTASSFRATFPADQQWVDHHSSGDVALLGITANAAQFDDLDFFNRSITQAYGPPAGLPGRGVQGKVCPWQVDRQGTLHVDSACGPEPHRFLVNDPSARVTFYDEVRSASDPKIGRVVEVRPDRPVRMRSLIVMPCPRPSPIYFKDKPDIVPATASMNCRPNLTGAMWVPSRATVEIRYRGGTKPHVATVGARPFPIAPGRETTVAVPVSRGYSQFVVDHDWSTSGGAPSVLSIDLVRGGRRTPLLSS